MNKKRKKNGAHTHVRTTVQLGEHNIHVSCCLFSHDQNNKYQSIYESDVMLLDKLMIGKLQLQL